MHATNTEKYLVGKKLLDVDVVQKALSIMGEEVQPDYTLPDPKPEFRRKLAQALFYRVSHFYSLTHAMYRECIAIV